MPNIEKKVCVTGASGFIGKQLCKALQPFFCQVVPIVRNHLEIKIFQKMGMKAILADVNSPEILSTELTDCDVICHLAVGGGDLESARKVNVEGTQNILNIGLKNKVQRIVHISSIAVYGNNLPHLVNEDYPLTQSGSPYAITKVEAEKIIERFRAEHNMDIVIIRPTIVYGPGSPLWTLQLFDRVKYDQIFLINHGRGIINLIYIDDLVNFIIKVISDPRAKNITCNANSSEIITWSEYLNSFCKMLNKPKLPEFSYIYAKLIASYYLWNFRFTRISNPIVPFDFSEQLNQTVFSCAKSNNILDFSTSVGFIEGMERTKVWLETSGYLPQNRSIQ